MNLDKADLVLRHDGACIYILGSDNRSFHGICSARNESFISYTSILKHDLKPESQSEVGLDVIKNAHPDIINEALSARRASKSQFNEWSLKEDVKRRLAIALIAPDFRERLEEIIAQITKDLT